MHTCLFAVGKLQPCYREACDDYLKRLRRYAPIVEREVREAGRAGTSALQRQEEGTRLAKAIPAGAVVVALDGGDPAWSSEDLARRLDAWRMGSVQIALVIGGAVGLEPAFVAGAAWRWSLGRLTLPHQLARVVVLEQWYRAWTILRGEPYHKGGRG